MSIRARTSIVCLVANRCNELRTLFGQLDQRTRLNLWRSIFEGCCAKCGADLPVEIKHDKRGWPESYYGKCGCP